MRVTTLVCAMAAMVASVVVPTEPARAQDTHDLLVVGMASRNLLRFDPRGKSAEVVDSGLGGLDLAHSIEIAPDGNYLISSFGSGDVLKYDSRTGEYLGVFIRGGYGGLRTPTFARIGPDGLLYVSSYNSDEVLRYNPTSGRFIDVFITEGLGGLNGPETPFWHDGKFYLVDGHGNRVLEFDAETGDYIRVYIDARATGAEHVHTVLWLDDGTVLCDGFDSGDVQRFDAETGEFLEVFIQPGTGGLNRPHGMAMGPDDGILYVLSGASDSILRFDGLTGDFIDEWAAPTHGILNLPTSLLFVPSQPLEVVGPVPGRAGETNTIGVSGALPGADVLFFWGNTQGVTDIPGCRGLKIAMRRPQQLGARRADANGRAFIEKFIPEGAVGRPVVIQVVDDGSCRVSAPHPVMFR